MSGEDKSVNKITMLLYFKECETLKNYLKEKETTPGNEGAKV